MDTANVKGEIELPSWDILNTNFENELDDFYYLQLDKLRLTNVDKTQYFTILAVFRNLPPHRKTYLD